MRFGSWVPRKVVEINMNSLPLLFFFFFFFQDDGVEGTNSNLTW